MKKINILILSVLLVGCSQTSTSEVASEASSLSESEIIESNENTVSSSVLEYTNEAYYNPVNVMYPNERLYKGEVADPTVIYDEESQMFYCFSTDRKMFSSEDGCNFILETENIIDLPDWGREIVPEGTLYVWAPDVIKIKDTWIYYYSLSSWGQGACGIGYAISEDGPAGPYEDMGKLFSCAEIGINNCIDSQVIVADNSVYMVAGSFCGVYIFELTDDGQELLGGAEEQKENKVLISGNLDGSWNSSSFEGSYITKKDNYYYYFGSTGSCCNGKDSTYQVRVARSEDILGPYIDEKGHDLMEVVGGECYGSMVVYVKDKLRDTMAGVGHNSIVIDALGDYWIYYHGYSTNDNFLTRHLFMDRLLWDDEGFPYVEGYTPSFDDVLDGPTYIIE